MNSLQLFKEMRHITHLSEIRNASYSQNRTAKVIMWIGIALVLIYLMSISVLSSLIVNDSDDITALEFLCSAMPAILTIDFFARFLLQQTPTQMVKPYILLPLPKHACIDNFVLSSLLSYGNFTWFAFFLPFCLMSVIFSYGIALTFYTILFFWILFLANSQWYAIIRTLSNVSVLYWGIVVIVYALVCVPSFIGEKVSINNVFDFYGKIGDSIADGKIWPMCIAVLLMFAMTLINRQVQYKHIYDELSKKQEDKSHKNIQDFSFLGNWGETGIYLQLEIKSIIRNKNPRRSFVFGSLGIFGLSLLITFTSIYDTSYMTNFWCTYNFMIYGSTTVLKIMSNEGNYMDCLMVRKENILSLLKAKYLFYSIILVFPFLLMLPTVINGKWSILMLVAYATFTAGFQNFILFQMAVYNKQTTPLNTKFISKGANGNNYAQMAVVMSVLFIPMTLITFLENLCGSTIAYLTILAIGIAFILTSKIWLRNIYDRMMKRRYENMAAFRESR